MLRIITIFFALTSSTLAQVTTPDSSLQEQLVPESFKLEATAIAAKVNLSDWRTTVSYALTNNSGMNLYIGIMMGSIAIGSCTEAQSAHGGLQLLPGPNTIAYPVDLTVGPPRPVFVPAGTRVAGTILVEDCSAPNPGSPTAPLSISLMIGKSEARKAMIQYPLSVDALIRQVQGQ